jgi:hypothetical protein
MLSATSFKDELRRFTWPKSSAIRQHLSWWRDDPNAEGIWQTIRAKSDRISAEEFIRVVIRARSEAGGLIPRIDRYRREREHSIRRHEKEIAEALKSNQHLSEMADALDAAAEDFRAIDGRLAADMADFPADYISQKDQDITLMRKMFWHRVGTFLHKRCGEWMDEQVGRLADIAFDTENDNAVDQIRAMRRRIRKGKSKTNQ